MNIEFTIENYLHNIRIPIRLAMIGEDGHPLVVSLWFYYTDKNIYCATNREARIVGILGNNPNVGFEIASDLPPYCGVRGSGVVSIEDDRDKIMLQKIYGKYFVNTDSKLYQYLMDAQREEVVLVIDPTKMHTWNFENRMEDAQSKEFVKICL